MINILLCGNEKVFDGALTELISITNKTKEPVNCYIFTMDLTRVKQEYTAITDIQIRFLQKVVESKNPENKITKIDVTHIYEKEFGKCANENAYCTPYTLLRLLADIIPNIPNKLLYLDIDMMAASDISELYNIDINDYEYAAVREKYGSKIIRPDYINAGMLLLNMKKIKETLQEYGIHYIINLEEENIKFNKPLSASNSTKLLKKCINEGCVNVYNGKISKCPLVMYIHKLNERFNVNFPTDGIYSLNDNTSAQELCEKLNKKIPLCTYCVDNPIEWEKCSIQSLLDDWGSVE